MIRDYNMNSPRIWTGSLGDLLRENIDAQRVALYLLTAPASNIAGLFRCPPAVIEDDINIGSKPLARALEALQKGGFLLYDYASKRVWVIEFARHQFQGEPNLRDNKSKLLLKCLEQSRSSPLLPAFLERYPMFTEPLLKMGIRVDFQAGLKPLPRGGEVGEGEGERDREGEEEENARARVTNPGPPPDREIRFKSGPQASVADQKREIKWRREELEEHVPGFCEAFDSWEGVLQSKDKWTAWAKILKLRRFRGYLDKNGLNPEEILDMLAVAANRGWKDIQIDWWERARDAPRQSTLANGSANGQIGSGTRVGSHAPSSFVPATDADREEAARVQSEYQDRVVRPKAEAARIARLVEIAKGEGDPPCDILEEPTMHEARRELGEDRCAELGLDLAVEVN